MTSRQGLPALRAPRPTWVPLLIALATPPALAERDLDVTMDVVEGEKEQGSVTHSIELPREAEGVPRGDGRKGPPGERREEARQGIEELREDKGRAGGGRPPRQGPVREDRRVQPEGEDQIEKPEKESGRR